MSRRKRKPLIVIKVPNQYNAAVIRDGFQTNQDMIEMRKDYHFIITTANVNTIEFEEFGTVYANNSNLKKVEEELIKAVSNTSKL